MTDRVAVMSPADMDALKDIVADCASRGEALRAYRELTDNGVRMGMFFINSVVNDRPNSRLATART